ncbi:hypothetical protein B0H67DRAFT_547934 [Lasiosphaeris hirsuta]|uniref:Uncharacterized protein n=1 Tax=Lasiosphaeris hirsuta TaxID=260670 RepID=A0AA40E7J1_9PEZI|nr:hypothetical protein B0H67DRAFT_547934 [Lasiosphaeris hirsuta]
MNTVNACYCANYYVCEPKSSTGQELTARIQGSINCRNTVAKFGERCKLCLALKSGASMSHGLLAADDLWMLPSSRPIAYNKDSSRSSSNTSGRSTWGSSYLRK